MNINKTLKQKLIRTLDVLFSVLGIVVLLPFLVLIIFCLLRESHSPLFRQVRVGRNGVTFKILKFRTMVLHAPTIPTHEVDSNLVTHLGKYLRLSKLDELPQLWNVMVGEMSLVGPRPCLPEQTLLIDERKAVGIDTYKPGITGLSQILGVKMDEPLHMVALEQQMLSTISATRYVFYIVLTLIPLPKKVKSDLLNS